MHTHMRWIRVAFFLLLYALCVGAEEDLYSVLGVPKTATTRDIKKAYRREALKWHPDKNPDKKEEATKRFNSIAEAYAILSDEKKREDYDRGGQSGSFGGLGGDFQFADADDIFKQFFGDGDPFKDLFGDVLSSFGDGDDDNGAPDMHEELRQFYLAHQPRKANAASVKKILKKYQGRERELHRKLKKKYGDAPTALLGAGGRRRMPSIFEGFGDMGGFGGLGDGGGGLDGIFRQFEMNL